MALAPASACRKSALCDQDRSPAEDGRSRLSQGEGDAAGLAQGAAALYRQDEAESIADSTFIRAHIEGKYGFDFDAPLSLQAACAGLGVRADDRAPCLLGTGRRALGRRATILPKGRRISSTGRPSICARNSARTRNSASPENYLLERLRPPRPDEDVDLAVRSLFALSVQLGDKAVSDGRHALRHRCHRLRCAGRNPDAVLCSSPLRERAEQFANLTAYVDRMMLSVLSGLRLGTAAASGLRFAASF